MTEEDVIDGALKHDKDIQRHARADTLLHELGAVEKKLVKAVTEVAVARERLNAVEHELAKVRNQIMFALKYPGDA